MCRAIVGGRPAFWPIAFRLVELYPDGRVESELTLRIDQMGQVISGPYSEHYRRCVDEIEAAMTLPNIPIRAMTSCIRRARPLPHKVASRLAENVKSANAFAAYLAGWGGRDANAAAQFFDAQTRRKEVASLAVLYGTLQADSPEAAADRIVELVQSDRIDALKARVAPGPEPVKSTVALRVVCLLGRAVSPPPAPKAATPTRAAAARIVVARKPRR